jgi:hypothetical protein
LQRPSQGWVGTGSAILFGNAWCVDGWFRPTNVALRRQVIFGDDISSGGNTYNIYCEIGTSGAVSVQVRSSTGAVSLTAPAGTITNNNWYHIAVVGLGNPSGAYRLYINGQLASSVTGVTYTAQQNGTVLWGEWNTAVGGVFVGSFVGQQKMQRITWGTPRYTANFVPPRTLADYAPPPGNDAFFAQTRLLLACNGYDGSAAFVDSSPVSRRCTRNGAVTVSTTDARFSGCAFFDGTAGRWINVPHAADLALGAGDFTLEGWVRPSSLTTDHTILGKRLTTGFGPFIVMLDSTGRLSSRSSFNGTTWGVQLLSTGTCALNTWTHWAYVRNGNVFTQYINGVPSGTTTVSGTLVANTEPIRIGCASNSTQQFAGRMDDIRITAAARYTGAFTPPSSPFPLA